jgi:hypothetical protein
MSEGTYQLNLTQAEALVLFEWLGRFNKIEDESRFVDNAEEIVLWGIECTLEKGLFEPITSKDYDLLIKEAYEKIRSM